MVVMVMMVMAVITELVTTSTHIDACHRHCINCLLVIVLLQAGFPILCFGL